LSHDDQWFIHHQSPCYLPIGDDLHCQGVDTLSHQGNFEPPLIFPYIFKQFLDQGEYIIECPKGDNIPNPHIMLYLKKFSP